MSPEAAGWVVAARLADLDGRDRTLAKVAGVEVALFRVGDAVFAVQNRCPHRQGPLVRGFLEPGPAIRCPMHGWRFDLRDGTSDRPARAVVYPVRVAGEQIEIRLPVTS